MTRRRLYETQRDACLASVREMRLVLHRLLDVKRVEPQLMNRICLAFAEAATNIVQHGTPKATQIKMQLIQDGGRFRLEVMDNGGVWDIARHPRQGLDAMLHEHESGRGLELIYSLADNIDYQPCYDGDFHCLSLSWALPQTHALPNLLIIEDDPIAQSLYVSYLSERYQVDTAEDGLQALSKCQQEDYDLLLCDINMPGMDGMNFRERLLEQKKGPLIPFIFLTAAEGQQLIEQANILGVDDFLQKPVTKNQLQQSVERALSRSGQLKSAMSEMINEQLCRSLLPNMPDEVPYWHCHLQQSHCSRGGGDIYQYFPYTDETGSEAALVLLADVEGHDETAKFFAHAFAGYLTGMINGYLDGLCSAELAGHVSLTCLMKTISNGIFRDKLLEQSTITLLLASIHSGGRIRIVSAGHPPPLRVSSGKSDHMSVGGMLPGLVECADYQEVQVVLEHDERVVLYTDGLLESKTATQEFVEPDIVQQINDSMVQPPERAARQLINKFEQLVDPQLQDDATLVLLQPKQG